MRSPVSAGSSAASTVSVAPSERATSSLAGDTSTATMGAAPAATAARMADRPTPPQPSTATRSPGRTPAVFHTAPTPVVTAQPTRAAISKGTSSGTGTQDRSGTTQRSAKLEMKE